MVVEQTVEIPASRRLTIDVPREVPAGRTILTFRPVSEIKQKSNTPITDRLAGCCAHLGDISLEEIHEERLAKHLQ